MPSSVRCPDGHILTTTRDRYAPANSEEENRAMENGISLYRGSADGRKWICLDDQIDTGGKSGNPPCLTLLQNGRLCLTYGYRAEPFEIRAVLADNEDSAWSDPIVIHSGAACHDLGYPRTVQRLDGKLVTVYYWCPTEFGERTIEATIWEA